MKNRLMGKHAVATKRQPSTNGGQASAQGGEATAFHPEIWLEEAGRFIGRHPTACVAAAAVGGVLLGVLLKRRK